MSYLLTIPKLSNGIKINYFVTTFILSTAIATCWYFYKENNNYEKGFKDGYTKKEIESRVDKKINLILNEKIDSIIAVKTTKVSDSISKK